MINCYLSSCAEQRLRHRSIKKEEIESVLAAPDYSYPGKQGELNFVKEPARGRKIRVVAVDEKDRLKIMTAIILT
jgi:Domain of unknown function (DUF4258)